MSTPALGRGPASGPDERAARAALEAPVLDVSIVIPIHNERENLEQLLAEIGLALEPGGRDYEVLLVDDGSDDGSLELLRRLAASDERLRVLGLEQRCGQSAALDAGFRALRGGIVVTLDADLQNDPADIPLLLHKLDEGWDMVSGVRRVRHDDWRRRASSRIANGVRRWVLGDSIRDIGCSLRAYRATWLDGVAMFDGMHRFLPALVELAGARTAQLDVHHRPRRHGRSKYGVNNRLWRGLRDLLAVRWMRRRWIDRRRARLVEPDPGPQS